MNQTGASATFVTVPIADALSFVLRGLPLAVLLAALAIAGSWFTAKARPVTYTTSALLLSVRQDTPATDVRSITPATLDPVLYRAAVHDGPVLQAVLDRLADPGADPATVKANLRITSDNALRSSVVRVEYSDADPARAEAVANLVAEELVNWDRYRTLLPLQEWRTRISNELAGSVGPEATGRLEAELAGLSGVVPLPQLSVLAWAELPTAADSAGFMTTAAILSVVAILVAYALLLVLRRPA